MLARQEVLHELPGLLTVHVFEGAVGHDQAGGFAQTPELKPVQDDQGVGRTSLAELANFFELQTLLALF